MGPIVTILLIIYFVITSQLRFAALSSHFFLDQNPGFYESPLFFIKIFLALILKELLQCIRHINHIAEECYVERHVVPYEAAGYNRAAAMISVLPNIAGGKGGRLDLYCDGSW